MTSYRSAQHWKVLEFNIIGLLLIPITLFAATEVIMMRDHLSFDDAWSLGWRAGTFVYIAVFVLFFWRFQKPKWGRVYKSIFAGEPEPENVDEAPQAIEPPSTYIGVAGPAFVPFWYRPAGDPISMTAELIEEMIEVNDMWGWRYRITYVTPMSPAPGRYLPNYQNYSDEEAREYLNAELESEVQSVFGQLDGKVVMMNIKEFQDTWFANALGGEGYLSEPEKVVGRYTRKLVIKSVLPGDEAQQTSELIGKVTRTIEAMKQFKEAGITDPKHAANLAALLDGAQITYISGDFTGLENMQNVLLGNPPGQRGNRPNKPRRGKGGGRRGP